MRKPILIALTAIIAGCTAEETDYTSYVDTSIGTGGHAQVSVGASVPFGAVRTDPTGIFDTRDGCSGYHISVLPVSTPVKDFSLAGMADKVGRDEGVSEPGYYSVPLKRSGVTVELTATERVGYHKYSFPAGCADAGLVFDLENGGCWDEVSSDNLTVINDTHLEGFRFSEGWADKQKIWFRAEFSTPFEACDEVAPHHWLLKFPNAGSVEMKVAVSPVSCEAAAANMAAELSGWGFEATKAAARAAWNKELGKVEIKTHDEAARKVFYTSLYTIINYFPDIYTEPGKLPVWRLEDFDATADADSDSGTYIDSKKPVHDALVKNLDKLLSAREEQGEPIHNIVYHYTMAGKPWKTADLVRKICTEQYSTAPDGLSGNEDVGQMSAWYILSSMGFYQVEPEGGRYWFGSPLFDEVTVHIAGGKDFKIVAEGNSDACRYIQRIYLNGKPYTKPFIDCKDIMAGGELRIVMGDSHKLWYCADEPQEYVCKRPAPEARLFTNPVIEQKIREVQSLLVNQRLAWMFANCFPNTLDTTVHFYEDDGSGNPDTFVYTGDIHAMWLRDSGAQVWPYLRFADDSQIRRMLEGTIRRQFKCLCIDPFANAFNYGPTGSEWISDNTEMKPELHERKWEIDSACYPIRLAYEYWKKTGDSSVFDSVWLEAIGNVLATFRDQQRKEGKGSYYFTRVCDAQYDMKCNYGYGNPVNPVGLIASAFRPSDDATIFDFLVPSNFFAMTSLRKAAEILETVNGNSALAGECRALADEVEDALYKYAVVNHPEFGKIFAYEVDGFGNVLLSDDANVPSLLAMAYLGDIDINDEIYQNTRNFVLSSSNPYRFEGAAGAGIGGPHIGPDYIWPMSIMMRAFTSTSDSEIQDCIVQLMTTDAGTGFMHEAFHVDDPAHYTRDWFAWQNTLFGELILKLIDDGKVGLLDII